ncbi:Transposase [Operophtera brumata]|uniref:Transposase n=1 Tax=Operophtera brumata TaxID=104452 RepID=A0A0L7LKZ1_OPEBR|nr:Transposase [Operophtera brumata]
MLQWSGEHSAFAIEAFFKSNDSYEIARRQLCSHFGIRWISYGPRVNLIRSWVQRFPATASAMNIPRPGPSRSSRTPENIELVERSLRENVRLSIRKRAADCP